MSKLSEEYQRLITLGIDSSANLSDLNDMTDRGQYALKPFTAFKTIGVMELINKYNIQSEDGLVEKFELYSKKNLTELTDQVYSHQLKYFKKYKYKKEVIFKYVYCCIIINSLKGYSTENKFDSWSKKEGILTRSPKAILDQKYHTDRIEIDKLGKAISFISIKPKSFANNFMQYEDVFAGLQFLANKYNKPWKIYYQNGNTFNLIDLLSLDEDFKMKINHLEKIYRQPYQKNRGLKKI